VILTWALVVAVCGSAVLLRARWPVVAPAGVALAVGITCAMIPVPIHIPSAVLVGAEGVLFASVGMRVGRAGRPLWPRELLPRLALGELAAAVGTGAVVWLSTHRLLASVVLGVGLAVSSVAVVGAAGPGATEEVLVVAASDDLVGLGLLGWALPKAALEGFLGVGLAVLGAVGSRMRAPWASAVAGVGAAILLVGLTLGARPALFVPLGGLVVAVAVARAVRVPRGVARGVVVAGRDLAGPVFFFAQGARAHVGGAGQLLVAVGLLGAIAASRAVWWGAKGGGARASATTARGVVAFVALGVAQGRDLVGARLVGAVTLAVFGSVVVAAVIVEVAALRRALDEAS
jgi:hypothetical protein